MKKNIIPCIIAINICLLIYSSCQTDNAYKKYYDEVSFSISKKLSFGTKVTIVAGRNSSVEEQIISRFLQSLLETDSLIVVNRNESDLKKINEEVEFQLLSGNVSDEYVVALGKMLNVDVVIIIYDKQIDYNNCNVQIRAIEVETGRIFYNNIRKMKYRKIFSL